MPSLDPVPIPRRTAIAIRIAVLASSILLMLPGAWGHSVTVVELAQLPAGLAAWQRHELGVYRVGGPAVKWLYAAPAYIAGVRVDYPEEFDRDVDNRQEWNLGRAFQAQHRPDYHSIYRWSRLLPILLTALGGWLICEWSTRLFGARAGIASLCAWCWLPPALAHGSLVTSDMPSAVAALLAARCFWAFLLRPGWATASFAGVTLGLAAATKFTLLVLYPCWGILLIGRAIQLRQQAPPSAPAKLLGLGLLIVIPASILALDAAYLFRDVGFRLGQWDSGKSSLAGDVRRLGDWGGTAWLLSIPMPIPLEFLRGLDVQLADTERQQEAYLLGQTRLGGWWYWYPIATLIKVPLPFLTLIALALIRLPGAIRGRDPAAWAALCTLVPAAQIALAIAASTGTGTNAAFRYLVPTLALACIWIGPAWGWRSRSVRILVLGLFAWLALDAASGAPDHLGWQNGLGRAWSQPGRPALVGDSLDWGQDLARLGEWVARHSPEGSTLVCAYGLGEAEPYGLAPPAARSALDSWDRAAYLAVSADILFGYESQYCVSVGGDHPRLEPHWREALQHVRPFDRVGRTIRIYRLSDLPPDLREGPERSAAYREQSLRVDSPQGEQAHRYRLLGPPEIGEGQRYPLLIYLHGVGARGDDNRRQLQDLPGRMLEYEYRRRYPCFVLAPQCPEGTDWSGYRIRGGPDDDKSVVLAIIEQALATRPVDPGRIYLTGFSMGAFGTWQVAARRPDLFAALVPVCGGSPESAYRLTHVPIWAIHGRLDEIVPHEHTRQTIEAIRAAGGVPHYTEVEDAGHSTAWAYDLRNGVLDWMFAQRRGQHSSTPINAVLPGR